ncbi:hypothetical protein MMC20_000119 [Loxospora ochrophaea]|nr:hypothetical protein [Loxospora ochrophaea]
MPRPKRTKLAPSAPSRVPLGPVPSVVNSLLQNSSPKSSRQETSTSDDSEGLVTKIKHGTGRRSANKPALMSGALAPGDTGGTRLRPPSAKQRAALSRVVRDAEYAKTIEASRRRREEATVKERENEILVPSSIPEAAVQQEATTTNPNQETVPSMTIERVRPDLIPKARATPAREPSILALSNIKRRPRQPSILQLGPSSASPSYNDLDEFDDFHPDDESTPFPIPKSHSRTTDTPISSSRSPPISRKRKLTPPEIQVRRSQSPTATSKPVTLTPPKPSINPDPDLYGISSDEASSEEPNLPLQRLAANSPPPQIWSDTMAPPESSSQSGSSPQPPTNSTRNHKLTTTSSPSNPRRPPRKANVLKPMTTATLQNLLPRRHPRKNAKSQNADPFDIPSDSDSHRSASIAAPASDADADELSRAAPAPSSSRRTTQRKAKSPIKSSNQPKRTKAPPSLAPAKPSTKRKAPTRKKNAPSAQSKQAATGAQPPAKTYTRRQRGRAASNKENDVSVSAPTQDKDATEKENEEDNEELISSLPADKGATANAELRKQAIKFKEVDKWSLEFEEVTASSSSPRDGR